MEKFADIKEELFSTNESSILLGNGFNMSIGLQTGSTNLTNKLKETEAIKDIYQALNDLENKEGLDLEEFATKIGNREKIIKKEIFKLIIHNSAPIEDSIAQKTMSFLAGFKWKFTTNYDPVVYRFVLWNQALYENKIENKGPFSIADIKEIFGTIPDALKKIEHADRWSCDEIRKLLHLESDDGFRRPAGRLRWVGLEQQNSFYLHGALHLYAKKGNICKRLQNLKELRSLQSILEEMNDSHLSIFQYKDKPRQIRRSEYLKYCLERLRKIPGPLCIIGWSCAKQDAHLARAIKKDKNRAVFASLHWQKSASLEEADACGEPKKTIQNYWKQFPKKQVRFFDIDTVDYKIGE